MQKDTASTLFTGRGNWDFYLFGILKQKLQSIDASNDESRKAKFCWFSRAFHRARRKSHSITESKDASMLSKIQRIVIHRRQKM
jgi:hypothetical protein